MCNKSNIKEKEMHICALKQICFRLIFLNEGVIDAHDYCCDKMCIVFYLVC